MWKSTSLSRKLENVLDPSWSEKEVPVIIRIFNLRVIKNILLDIIKKMVLIMLR